MGMLVLTDSNRSPREADVKVGLFNIPSWLNRDDRHIRSTATRTTS
jgi:hypothetical protein